MSSWRLEYSIDVYVDTATVFVKVLGQWKAEVAEAYHESFKEEMAPLLGKPWAKIVDLSNWKVSRQEVTEIIGRHMAWSRDNGVALSIYVLSNQGAFRQLNDMFEAGGTKDISQTFRTWEEAEKFLKENWPPARTKEPKF